MTLSECLIPQTEHAKSYKETNISMNWNIWAGLTCTNDPFTVADPTNRICHVIQKRNKSFYELKYLSLICTNNPLTKLLTPKYSRAIKTWLSHSRPIMPRLGVSPHPKRQITKRGELVKPSPLLLVKSLCLDVDGLVVHVVSCHKMLSDKPP